MKENHCNILINQNTKDDIGNIEDVLSYLSKIKNQAENKYQIKLEEEIRIINKFNTISDILGIY